MSEPSDPPIDAVPVLDFSHILETIRRTEVNVENFRPGVMARIGLGYGSAPKTNLRIVYVSATGYGTEGPWRDRPGEDLPAQAVSRLPWLNGSRGDGPVPVGLSITATP